MSCNTKLYCRLEGYIVLQEGLYCDLKGYKGNCIAIYKSVLQGKETGKLYCNVVVQ